MGTLFTRHCIFVGTWLLVLPLVTFAHHSFGAFFDRSTVSELGGTITRILWRNPHVGFVLLTDTGEGDEEWTLEGDAINSLERSGITRELFDIGDRVRVAGWPDRRGGKALFVTNLLLPNGDELKMRVDNAPPLRWTDDSLATGGPVIANVPIANLENRGLGVFRVWTRGEVYRLRSPLVFTAAASAARASWDPLNDDPSLRCIPPGMPNAILNPYPIEFIDEGEVISLRIEEWEAVRTIHMTTTQLPENAIPSPLGHSVGRWEERTLIVHTNRVNWPLLNSSGTPQSENVAMIERFTISEDESRLHFEITVTDPQNLTEPAIWEATYVWDPRIDIKSFECAVDSSN